MDSTNPSVFGTLNGKLVSIDIETTGLDADKHDILEIAAICFSLDPGNTSVQRFHGFIKHDVVRWDEGTFDFHMKNDYFNYVRSEAMREVFRYTKGDFVDQFAHWLALCGAYTPGKSRDGGATAVGKNFASFDLQFLNNIHPSFKEKRLFKHRTVDLGNLLWQPMVDGVILPSSEKCAERMGFSGAAVKHRAMDDAQLMMTMCRSVVMKMIATGKPI